MSKLETLERFVENYIDEMQSTLSFTASSEDMNENEKIDFALYSLKETKSKVFAVINFVNIYENEIGSIDAEELKRKFNEKYRENRNIAFNINKL